MKNEEENEISSWDNFNDINDQLMRGIYSYGFESPSPIQKQAIGPMIEGKDIVAQAQSGTGKTGCFSIGILSRIDTSINQAQAIVISPTRELSIQTKNVIESIGSMIPNLCCQLLVGGRPTSEDVNNLHTNKPHVLIGCPGRILDMLHRKAFTTKELITIVIDEADEMLSSGFQEQIYEIFKFTTDNTQLCLFSATLHDSIIAIANKIMKDPVQILVKNEQLTLEGINQYYIALDNDNSKYEALKDLYGVLAISQSIVYCNSVRRVQELYEAMIVDQFPVCRIHGNMSKNERNDSYNDFRTGKTRVLISSNITARGIDVQQVSTVINFDVPKCVHTYLHRIGRSGRWGRKGMGINFITQRDVIIMKDIEQYYHTEISELPQSAVELS